MLCEKCQKKMATERHHRFSQKGWVKKLYPIRIHDEKNIQYLCYDCHHNKPLDKWTETEFCVNLGIEPKSKVKK